MAVSTSAWPSPSTIRSRAAAPFAVGSLILSVVGRGGGVAVSRTTFEQLRLLEADVPIQTFAVAADCLSVDTPAQLALARQRLAGNHRHRDGDGLA